MQIYDRWNIYGQKFGGIKEAERTIKAIEKSVTELNVLLEETSYAKEYYRHTYIRNYYRVWKDKRSNFILF